VTPDIALSVENLSKLYLIGHQGVRRDHTALRDVISREARSFLRKGVALFHGRQIVQGDEIEEFWALKDVSFEVKEGEVVGIIGANGAGKSTLLKILSRIIEPSEGRVRLRGRVSSLLEVGTGFHPELTGRENIFLNGTILGMSRRDIRRKFDEIVAFAEVEQFLDTPVKRYSSGMYVRLAFAVAAHLEPEILVVDEILAVGDATFQRKCLGKLQGIAKGGTTVLFVSHNMGSISTLCGRAIYLENGRAKQIGPVNSVLREYLSDAFEFGVTNLDRLRSPGHGDRVRFVNVKLESRNGAEILFGDPVVYILDILADVEVNDIRIGSGIWGNSGTCIGSLITKETFSIVPGEKLTLRLVIPRLALAPGIYHAGFSIAQGGRDTLLHLFDVVTGIPIFQIMPDREANNLVVENWQPSWGNIVISEAKLEVQERRMMS